MNQKFRTTWNESQCVIRGPNIKNYTCIYFSKVDATTMIQLLTINPTACEHFVRKILKFFQETTKTIFRNQEKYFKMYTNQHHNVIGFWAVVDSENYNQRYQKTTNSPSLFKPIFQTIVY